MNRITLSILLIMLTGSAFAIDISEVKALAVRGFAPAQFSMGIA